MVSDDPMAPSEIIESFDEKRKAKRAAYQRERYARKKAGLPIVPKMRGRPSNATLEARKATLEPEEDLESLRLELTRHGALTREDRIALATKWARHSDPSVALPWARFLEAMDTRAQSDKQYGVPPPTRRDEQALRLSTLMIAVGAQLTREALEMARLQWRMNGTSAFDMPELPGTEADLCDPSGKESPSHGGNGSAQG